MKKTICILMTVSLAAAGAWACFPGAAFAGDAGKRTVGKDRILTGIMAEVREGPEGPEIAEAKEAETAEEKAKAAGTPGAEAPETAEEKAAETAEAKDPETAEEKHAEAGAVVMPNADGLYRVRVLDPDGTGLEEVAVQFCSDTACMFGETDEDGIAEFRAEEGPVYEIHIMDVPDGFEEPDETWRTPGQYCDVAVTLRKTAP